MRWTSNVYEKMWNIPISDTEWVRYRDCLCEYEREYGHTAFLGLTANGRANLVTEWITRANDECMKRAKKSRRRRVAWWSNELDSLRKYVARMRRKYQKARRNNSENAREKWNEWRECVNVYKRKIRESKEGNWRNFVGREGSNAWGKVYKICRAKRKEDLAGLRSQNGETITWDESANVLLNEHFPSGDGTIEVRMEIDTNVEERMEEFEWTEVDGAVRKIKMRKAPGLDGVTGAMIKNAWAAIPLAIKSTYDACLREENFPGIWKEARAIALLKGVDNNRKESRSYRLISLLCGLCKILERMMTERMLKRMNGKWNERQYGFMIRKSTEDSWLRLNECVSEARKKYVLGILVDFKSAFDCLLWKTIFKSLRENGCTENEWRL